MRDARVLRRVSRRALIDVAGLAEMARFHLYALQELLAPPGETGSAP